MTQDEKRLEVFERVVGTAMPHEAPDALADHIITLEARIAELEAKLGRQLDGHLSAGRPVEALGAALDMADAKVRIKAPVESFDPQDGGPPWTRDAWPGGRWSCTQKTGSCGRDAPWWRGKNPPPDFETAGACDACMAALREAASRG